MNPLPRFVALALFVLLAAAVGLLALSTWRIARDQARPADTAAPAARPEAPRLSRAVVLSQRFALGLTAAALALTLVLILGQPLRAALPRGTDTPFARDSAELHTLARLAESSEAQGRELTRERDVRRRAEEDAQLKQQLLTQSLDEKIRLGRDLHDGIIQSLYAAGLTLETVRALVKSDPDEAELRLAQTRDNLNGAIRDVRAYIVGLAPENLRRTSFTHALGAQLKEIGRGHDARFDLQIDDEAAARLTPEQGIEVLQIAREAVSNALRHGRAARVTVRMHATDTEICLLVQDDGRGFDPAQTRDGGHGLGNMHARAQRLGADLRITGRPGAGVRVLATLPVSSPAAV
jgi:signal transduction histidine kinase